MTVRRRLRRNSLKDFLQTFYYNGTRRFSKDLKIHENFTTYKEDDKCKNFKELFNTFNF